MLEDLRVFQHVGFFALSGGNINQQEVATMNAREQRQNELQAMMATQDGLLEIMKIYHRKVSPPNQPGPLGRIGLLACQMIPRILAVEFPKPDEH